MVSTLLPSPAFTIPHDKLLQTIQYLSRRSINTYIVKQPISAFMPCFQLRRLIIIIIIIIITSYYHQRVCTFQFLLLIDATNYYRCCPIRCYDIIAITTIITINTTTSHHRSPITTYHHICCFLHSIITNTGTHQHTNNHYPQAPFNNHNLEPRISSQNPSLSLHSHCVPRLIYVRMLIQ